MSREDHFQDLTVAGKVSLGAQSKIEGNLTPDTDDNRDLGSSTNRWRNLHLANTATFNVSKLNNIRFVDVNGEFTTIQAAIDDLPSTGGMVYVPAGTYSESITLASNITVMGSGRSTIIQATGNDVTIVLTRGGAIDTTAVGNMALSNVLLDANSFTGVIGLDVFSTQDSEFRNIWLENGNASGTAVCLRATNNTSASNANDNTTDNGFYNIWADDWDIGLQLDGDPGGGAGLRAIVTNNRFFNTNLTTMNSFGIDFVQWCDSNHFFSTRISPKASVSGFTHIIFNSETPAGDEQVYNETFWQLGMDSSPVAAATGFDINFSREIIVRGGYHSPPVWNGTYIDASANASSYLIEELVDDGASEQWLKVHSKNWRFDHIDAQGTGTGAIATAGAIRLPNNVPIRARDNGDTANINLIAADTNDRAALGGTSTDTSIAGGLKLRNVQTLDDTGTPSISNGNVFTTGGTTAITAFDDPINGQIIYIISSHSVTITDASTLNLSGAANYDMTADDTLTLAFNGTNWYELGRSVN